MSRILRVVCVIVIVAMTYAHFSDALAICTIQHQCFSEPYDPAASPHISSVQIAEVNDRLFTMLHETIERGDYLVASLVLPQIGDPYMGDMMRLLAISKWGDVTYPKAEYNLFTKPGFDSVRVSISKSLDSWVEVFLDGSNWNLRPKSNNYRLSVAGTITDQEGTTSAFAFTVDPGTMLEFREGMHCLRSGMITLSHKHIPPLMAENCFSHPDCFFYLPDVVGAFASARGADFERHRQMHQFVIDSEVWGRRITMEQINATAALIHNMYNVRHEMIPSLRNRIELCPIELPGQSH